MPQRRRDPRLDFFRGLAMLIIFVAHVRGNSWTQFIPARFGFSSAAEIFVFCSGYASALAFGTVFIRDGWRAGLIRILRRIWALYWVHIGLFLLLAVVSACVRFASAATNASADLGLGAFATDRLSAIARVMTLSYVPDLLNIIPMYIVLLGLVPLAMAACRVSPWLVVVASAALWLAVQATDLNLPAGGAAGRVWFFDPFAWQLLFLTGFAFGMRWLPAPPLDHALLLPVCATAVALSVPLNFWAFTDNVAALRAIHDALIPNGVAATTRLHPLRYAHFLCLSYVVLSLIGRAPKALASPTAAPVLDIGQQSLPAFVSSVVLAWMAGFILDVAGRDFMPTAVVNVTGLATIYAVARAAAWAKSPRRQRPLEVRRKLLPST